MRTQRNPPTVHAGSMADIAFLLLIFFMVTTTIANEKGISRKLPPPCPVNQDCSKESKERNILQISLNARGELLVDTKPIAINELRNILKTFIDNNGDGTCQYCFGSRDKDASENPNKAILTINTHRETPYLTYIAIQNEISAAYAELRETFVRESLQKNSENLNEEEQKKAMQAYPFLITEVSYD
jgi:biopolymer transport protein ExbD